MARDHGRIASSIWSDDDFTALDAGPQRLYLFLLSQVDLSRAGVVAMRLRRWATRAAGLDVDTLLADLDALEQARFVVVDHDTEEVLIRTFILNDGVYRQPNVMKAAVTAAREILSPTLRSALAEELVRIPVHELPNDPRKGSADPSTSPRGIVAACVAELLEALGNPSQNPSGNPTGRVAGTLPDTPPVRAALSLSPTPSPSEPPADRDAAAVDEGPGTDDGAVSPETSTEARAGAAPSSPDPVLDIAEQLSALTGDPIEAVVLGTVDDDPGPDSAQTLLAEWIDHCGQRPPGRVIGHVARELKTMLDEGIPDTDVRAGLVAWHQRGLHPSALASVVHETRTAADRRPRDRQTDILRAEYAAAQAADAATTNQPLALGSTA